MTAGRWDALGAVVAGGAALAVYLRTLAPGLVSSVDTPMFQFIGRVLGVPHNPGYPLYVLLTHGFSYVPVGSLAYRINLFSALFGAVTVSLVFLAARQLGCRLTISLAAALGLAFGHIFWSQSIIAEVYTLNAAIVAAMLLALLVWRGTGRATFFFAAVGLFAAGLGNHTTIVGFAPGMAAYALLADRRFSLRPRTAAAVAAIVAAGLVQYGFILFRSRDPGAYVESRAENVPELLRVMTGAQFENRLFAFDWRAVLFDRIPWLVQRVLMVELTAAGLLLAIAGAVWLVRRRLSEAVLLLLGFLAIVAFAANYNVIDTPVFLIPATLVLWLLAAVGMERTASAAGAGGPAAAVSLAAFALPLWLLTGNFGPTDRRHDVEAAVQLEGLFAALPDRSALVHEDFLVDRMVLFKLLGEDAAHGRRIALAPRDAAALRRLHGEGTSVFGFQKSVRRLRHEGLNFAFAPLPVSGSGLMELLGRLSAGTVVAIALPAHDLERLAGSGELSFGAIGGPRAPSPAPAGHTVLVGVRGARRGALVRHDEAEALIEVRAGGRIGETGAAAAREMEIRAGPAGAVVRQGGRDLVRTAHGAAVAIWHAEGRLEHAFVLDRADGYRVPLKTGPLSVYPLRGVWTSQVVTAGEWTDLTNAVRTGSVMLRLPPRATLILYCVDTLPLAPRVVDRSSDAVTVDVRPMGPGAATPSADGIGDIPLEHGRYMYRIQVEAAPVSSSVLLALGGVAHATARLAQPGAGASARAFSVDTQGLLRTFDRGSEVLLMARDEQAQLVGAGWSAVDADAFTAYRWLTEAEARLLLPVAKPEPSRIRVQAFLAAEGGPASLGLRLNDVELPWQPLRHGWHSYEWALEAGMLREGTNEASVLTDRQPPTRAVAVADVRVIQGR